MDDERSYLLIQSNEMFSVNCLRQRMKNSFLRYTMAKFILVGLLFFNLWVN